VDSHAEGERGRKRRRRRGGGGEEEEGGGSAACVCVFVKEVLGFTLALLLPPPHPSRSGGLRDRTTDFVISFAFWRHHQHTAVLNFYVNKEKKSKEEGVLDL
jgi:hypothetical protein